MGVVVLMDGRFWTGVAFGVAGVWAYNRWMRPAMANGANGRRR